VDDAFVVRGRERVGNRDADVEDAGERQSFSRENLLQALALDKLHGQKLNAGVLFDREQGDDVRMIEPGDDFRFALEALEANRIGSEIGGKHLDRDVAIEPGIARAIHFTHATFAEQAGDLVVPQLLSDQVWTPVVGGGFRILAHEYRGCTPPVKKSEGPAVFRQPGPARYSPPCGPT
jgi:hypothetical protein